MYREKGMYDMYEKAFDSRRANATVSLLAHPGRTGSVKISVGTRRKILTRYLYSQKIMIKNGRDCNRRNIGRVKEKNALPRGLYLPEHLSRTESL